MSESAIRAALIVENQGRCNPPLDEHEVVRIAASVGKYSPNQSGRGNISSAHGHADSTSGQFSPVLMNMAKVQPEEIEWLWPGRIAIGKLTLITGDPGLGKSLVSLDIAARLTTGRGWPDASTISTDVGSVVLLSAEDNPADTIRPRLDAAGADVQRVEVLSEVRDLSIKGHVPVTKPFNLVEHTPQLAEAVEQSLDCRLVIIDPVAPYLGQTDSHKDANVRRVLQPLANLAARHHVAVVLVNHLNKRGGGPAMYRSMGSLAFPAAARAVWAISKDPDDDRRRLMLPIERQDAHRAPVPDPGGERDPWRPMVENETGGNLEK